MATTTGVHGVKSCVASGHTDGMGTGPSRRSATAKYALSRERAVVHVGSDVDSISSIATVEMRKIFCFLFKSFSVYIVATLREKGRGKRCFFAITRAKLIYFFKIDFCS